MRVISGVARGTKLSSIESIETRPTLDRVKESLFNIIQNRIPESIVLDLFAGSGALGIECISRGCKKAYFGEKSKMATEMIKSNLKKTRFLSNSEIYMQDYRKTLTDLSLKKLKFNIIFIDPPYKENIAVKAIEQIINMDLLEKDGIIILETDEKEREIKQLEKLDIEIYDLRKYGRVYLLFLNRKG